MALLTEGATFAGKFKVGKQMFSGSLTEVWSASPVGNGAPDLALKLFLSEKRLDPMVIRLLNDEFSNKKIKHQCILLPTGFDVSGTTAFLSMPLMKRGSIERAIRLEERTAALAEREIVTLIAQIAGALTQLHKYNYVHMDVAPSNILIGDDGKFLLADFGLSRILHNTLGHAVGVNRIIHIDHAAPERFESMSSGPAADVFSLGVIAMELARGGALWPDEGGKALLAEGAVVPSCPEQISDEFNEKIRQCLARVPEMRPTAADLEKWALEYVVPKPEVIRNMRADRAEREKAAAIKRKENEEAVKARLESERKTREEAMQRIQDAKSEGREASPKKKKNSHLDGIEERAKRLEAELRGLQKYIDDDDSPLSKEKAGRQREDEERKAREDADRKEREEAERLAREAAERKIREETERKVREEAERKAREAAERKIREETERKVREEAERKAREAAERKLREEAERKAREAAERKTREEAERKAREEAERKAREEAERKMREEAERKVREEAERKAREEAERKAREEAERKMREEAERKAREEAERKVREEAERKAREEAERKAREEAERKVREEAERKAREESELKSREEAERKALEEAERKAREESERKAREEAKRKALEEVELKAREEAERKAREEAEAKSLAEAERQIRKAPDAATEIVGRNASEEAERKTREEAECKAREEAEAKSLAEAERQIRKAPEAATEIVGRNASEEAERKTREEAERKTHEEADRKAREEAERKAREEAERKAREEAVQVAVNEAKRIAREEAERALFEESRRRKEEEGHRALEEQRRREEETAERLKREENERNIRWELERVSRLLAEQKEREEIERRSREEAERKARELAEQTALAEAERQKREEERRVREESERAAREEAVRRAREEAERRAREEVEASKKADAERRAKEKAERKARGRNEREERERQREERERQRKEDERQRKEDERRAREEKESRVLKEAEIQAREVDRAEAARDLAGEVTTDEPVMEVPGLDAHAVQVDAPSSLVDSREYPDAHGNGNGTADGTLSEETLASMDVREDTGGIGDVAALFLEARAVGSGAGDDATGGGSATDTATAIGPPAESDEALSDLLKVFEETTRNLSTAAVTDAAPEATPPADVPPKPRQRRPAPVAPDANPVAEMPEFPEENLRQATPTMRDRVVMVNWSRLVTFLLLGAMGFVAWWYFYGGGASGPTDITILRIQGASSMTDGMVPDLVEAYFRRQGASDVSRAEQAGIVTISGVFGGDSLRKVDISTAGSDAGIAAVCGQNAELAFATRAATAEELGTMDRLFTGGSEHLVGLDGIALVVHGKNPVTSLSLDEVRGVLTGRIGSWSRLGRYRQPITVYAAAEAPGSAAALTADALGAFAFSKAIRFLPSEDSVLALVAGDASGVGFVGTAHLKRAGGRDVRVLELSDRRTSVSRPTEEQLLTESYTLTRHVYLYHAAETSNPFIEQFAAFVESARGQEVISKHGFTPLAVREFDPDFAKSTSDALRDAVRGARQLTVHFRLRYGSTELDTRSRRDVELVARYLSDGPGRGKKLLLFGYSDGLGNGASERLVASTLAKKVEAQFESHGVHAALVEGLGAVRPVADDGSQYGRERNRRVEAWVK